MRPRAPVVVVLTLLVVGALGIGVGASAPAASKIVDRTLLCATGLSGGVYEVEARAGQGIRERASKWKQLPYAVVASGSVGSRANALDDSLASVTAGRPSATTTIDTEFRATPALVHGTLTVRLACRASKARVPLTAGRLQGGAASPFGDEYDCSAPRRVLVRVRAVMKSPASLRTHRPLLRTNVPAQEARLAVRTQSGKPLVYAEVFESGKALLFVSKNCAPD